MNRQLKKTAIAAVFAALLAVLSMLVIPMPAGVPITLQIFGVALCGYCIGRKRGLAAVATYLAVGACGLPIFAGFGGGLGWLLGPTGGFLWGFLPMVALCGLGKGGFWKKSGLGLCGLVICWGIGVVQYTCVTDQTLWQSLLAAWLPYAAKDVACLFGAVLLANRLPSKIFQ